MGNILDVMNELEGMEVENNNGLYHSFLDQVWSFIRTASKNTVQQPVNQIICGNSKCPSFNLHGIGNCIILSSTGRLNCNDRK